MLFNYLSSLSNFLSTWFDLIRSESIQTCMEGLSDSGSRWVLKLIMKSRSWRICLGFVNLSTHARTYTHRAKGRIKMANGCFLGGHVREVGWPSQKSQIRTCRRGQLEIRASAEFIGDRPGQLSSLAVPRHPLHDPWGARSDGFVRNSRREKVRKRSSRGVNTRMIG